MAEFKVKDKNGEEQILVNGNYPVSTCQNYDGTNKAMCVIGSNTGSSVLRLVALATAVYGGYRYGKSK